MSARYRVTPLLEAQREAWIQPRPTVVALLTLATPATPALQPLIGPSQRVTSNATAVRGDHSAGPPFGGIATPGHEYRWSAPTMENLSTTIGDIRRPTKAVGPCVPLAPDGGMKP